MWDCEHCGCQAIAGDLEFCPQCRTPREQEDVPAESSAPGASATSDVVRETPQALSDDGDWGSDNA